MNPNNKHKLVTERLLGTTISLIGSTTDTKQYKCGTIDSVNPVEVNSVEAQTYTIDCPSTTEPTISVYLFDDEIASDDLTHNRLVMNIAEVRVYGKPSK